MSAYSGSVFTIARASTLRLVAISCSFEAIDSSVTCPPASLSASRSCALSSPSRSRRAQCLIIARSDCLRSSLASLTSLPLPSS